MHKTTGMNLIIFMLSEKEPDAEQSIRNHTFYIKCKVMESSRSVVPCGLQGRRHDEQRKLFGVIDVFMILTVPLRSQMYTCAKLTELYHLSMCSLGASFTYLCYNF